jgi:hypothetical protein
MELGKGIGTTEIEEGIGMRRVDHLQRERGRGAERMRITRAGRRITLSLFLVMIEWLVVF